MKDTRINSVLERVIAFVFILWTIWAVGYTGLYRLSFSHWLHYFYFGLVLLATLVWIPQLIKVIANKKGIDEVFGVNNRKK